MTEKHKIVQVERKLYVGLQIVYTQKFESLRCIAIFPSFLICNESYIANRVGLRVI